VAARIRKLPIVLAVLALAALGWNGFAWYKRVRLSEMAAPFFAACQSNAGCIIVPDGWNSDMAGGFSKDTYEYMATKDSFTLRQHLATDVWLIAEGGKDKPVHTYRVVN
jgi:hypothetical protein